MFSHVVGINLLVCTSPKGLGNVHLERKEAVALLKELGDERLLQPFMVIIQQRPPNGCQLQIKGLYDQKEIESFLKNRGFSYEEHLDYLLIFKP